MHERTLDVEPVLEVLKRASSALGRLRESVHSLDVAIPIEARCAAFVDIAGHALELEGQLLAIKALLTQA